MASGITNTQNNPSIVISSLSKRYSSANSLALDNVSLRVDSGEVYGFLGPNGAGKSTAIRILLNFLQPTAGSAQILGLDIVKDSVNIRRNVGYLSGDFAIYPKMTAEQYLKYMHQLQPYTSQKYLNELISRLKAEMHKPMGSLSRGNRQKIGIIQAFMHKPSVLILDEPTSGLDPLMQEVFYELVSEAKKRGSAVFVSSHILSEVQKICDRVGIIKSGKLVDERNISDMVHEASQTFEIAFVDKPPIAELKKIVGLKLVRHKGSEVRVHVHGSLRPLFSLLSKHEVSSIDASALELEELFLGFYSEGDKK